MSEEKETQDKQKTKKKTKIDPSALVRALALRVQEEVSPDLSPKYIGKRGQGERNNVDNGIICRAHGYYRLAEDASTGNRVLLHSSNYSDLVGYRDEEGRILLKHPENVIPVSAYCPVLAQDKGRIKGGRPMKGRKFRDDMNNNEAKMRESSQNSLNFYPSDITTLLSENEDNADENNKRPLRTIIIPNDKISYGIYEQEDGKFLLRRHVNTEDQPKKSEAFVSVDEQAPDGPLDQAVSMGEKIDIYDSLPAAYAHLIVESEKRADRIEHGQSALTLKEVAKSPATAIKRKMFGSIVSYFKTGQYKELFLAGALTAASTAVLGPLKHAKWLIAAKTFVGSLVGMRAGKTLEGGYDNVYDKTGNAIKRHLKSGKKKKAKEKKNQPFVNVKDYYILDTAENKASLKPRLDPHEAPELRLLTQEESDMNYDDGQTVDAETDSWLEESIIRSLSQPQPSHGFPINDSMMSFYHLKSGLVLLTHFNEAAKNTTVYALHRPELAIGNDDPLAKTSARKLKDMGIVKVEQKINLPNGTNEKSDDLLNKVFNEAFIENAKEKIGLGEEKEEGGENHKMKALTNEEFEGEVMELLHTKDNAAAGTTEEKKQTLRHIHTLFNTKLGPDTEKWAAIEIAKQAASSQSPWSGTHWDLGDLGDLEAENEETNDITDEEKLIARLTKNFEGMDIPPLRPAVSSLSLTHD